MVEALTVPVAEHSMVGTDFARPPQSQGQTKMIDDRGDLPLSPLLLLAGEEWK